MSTVYSKRVWDQLNNKTVQDIQKAMKRDGWVLEDGNRGPPAYHNPNKPPNANRIVLHVHPKQVKGPKVLKKILDDLGWTEQDMLDLKLVK